MHENYIFTGRSSRPIWDSDSQRSETASGESSSRRPPVRPLGTFDYDPMPYLPSAYQAPTAGGVKKKEGESYKEISRRLDCKLIFTHNKAFFSFRTFIFNNHFHTYKVIGRSTPPLMLYCGSVMDIIA